MSAYWPPATERIGVCWPRMQTFYAALTARMGHDQKYDSRVNLPAHMKMNTCITLPASCSSSWCCANSCTKQSIEPLYRRFPRTWSSCQALSLQHLQSPTYVALMHAQQRGSVVNPYSLCTLHFVLVQLCLCSFVFGNVNRTTETNAVRDEGQGYLGDWNGPVTIRMLNGGPAADVRLNSRSKGGQGQSQHTSR
jgi:hypothetical protein